MLRCLRNGEEITGMMERISPELSGVQGIVMKGPKVVPPIPMRAEMLARIHEGHLGINKCEERARRLVFWPGLSGGNRKYGQSMCRLSEIRIQAAQ